MGMSSDSLMTILARKMRAAVIVSKWIRKRLVGKDGCWTPLIKGRPWVGKPLSRVFSEWTIDLKNTSTKKILVWSKGP